MGSKILINSTHYNCYLLLIGNVSCFVNHYCKKDLWSSSDTYHNMCVAITLMRSFWISEDVYLFTAIQSFLHLLLEVLIAGTSSHH